MVNQIHNLIQKFGFDVIRYKGYTPGRFPLEDMSKFINKDQTMIFDVGANIGQSIELYKSKWPNSTIHSFEPSPATFEKLHTKHGHTPGTNLWNIALGSKAEDRLLYENSRSLLTSLLPLGELGRGNIVQETSVPVITVDQFCSDRKINRIDIFKIDTQGYDFEVIKGAEQTIKANKIGLLYFEIIFSKEYENLPQVPEILDFLAHHGFLLVTLYPFSFRKGLASETNGLFIHKSYLNK